MATFDAPHAFLFNETNYNFKVGKVKTHKYSCEEMKNMDPLPIFWSFRRCPYAMRARLAVKSSGLALEMREILLRDKPDGFLKVSQTATVPVVEMPDGHVIEESLDIMFWALQITGDPENWLTGWHNDKAGTDDFIAQLDGPFKANLDRYKYATRYAQDKSDAAEIAFAHRGEGAAFLQLIDTRLSKQGFLNGKEAGLADFAALPFIRQFRIADPVWFDEQDWPSLHPWLQAFLDSQRFAAIMQKYTPWQDGDAPLIF